MAAKKTEPANRAEKGILIVDDHPMIRLGMAALIASDPSLAVCGEASTCQGALHAIPRCKPDLVIVDIELEGADGLELIKDMKVHYPKLPVLVLSMHDESLYAERALRAGARGYMTKQQPGDMVLMAIRRVLNGEVYLSEKTQVRLADKIFGNPTPSTDSRLGALTDRELTVFRLIGQGQGTRQIAQRLHLSIKTIESYREHIKQKLTLESGTELARHATLWVETGRTN